MILSYIGIIYKCNSIKLHKYDKSNYTFSIVIVANNYARVTPIRQSMTYLLWLTQMRQIKDAQEYGFSVQI